MLLDQILLEVDDIHCFSEHSNFTQNIPVEWIESALTLSSKATVRRRLASDQVLLLVVGMALF